MSITRSTGRLCAAAALVCAGTPALAADDARVQDLADRMAQLVKMVQQLDGEVRTLKTENEALRAQAKRTEARVQAVPAAAEPAPAAPRPLDNVNLWGYGELYAMDPVHDRNLAQADLARAVFGIGYQFNADTRFNSEYEIEHAVTSAGDAGEFEVEQFYIERALGPDMSLQVGLLLMPMGFLNENHEPTHFYGVQRNFVETLIIPSTWREGGVKLGGTTAAGLRWSLGLTTAPDVAKWDFTPEFVPYRTALELENNGIGPLQATHQELSLARGRNLGQFVALDYLGVNALRLGASAFTGQAGRVAAGLPEQRTTLWEAHGRWNPGAWQLSALVAQGTISNTGPANRLFPGSAHPMPARFDGWLVEAAYDRLWQSGDWRLAPFARYERYDLSAAYDGLAPGFGSRPTAPLPTADGGTAYYPYAQDRVATMGAHLYLTQGIVFKVDYQYFRTNTNFSRLDFGLGVAFN
ncbi:MAG: porin [Burkholderiales bacterium]|nr:porin [Burkholderiales bacterium]